MPLSTQINANLALLFSTCLLFFSDVLNQRQLRKVSYEKEEVSSLIYLNLPAAQQRQGQRSAASAPDNCREKFQTDLWRTLKNPGHFVSLHTFLSTQNWTSLFQRSHLLMDIRETRIRILKRAASVSRDTVFKSREK